MPRTSRGPHLYLKDRADAESVWYIRDGKKRVSTGYGEGNPDGARQALATYLAQTASPDFGDGHPSRVEIADVIALYSLDVASKVARPREASARLGKILDFFGKMKVDKITPSLCKAYARSRGAQQAARRELADLKSALAYAFKSRKLLFPVPVDLPAASMPRERWLTKQEAARLLLGAMGFRLAPCSDAHTRKVRWAIWARNGERNPHVARFILIGLGTGTRHDAILSLGFHPHVGGGHVDLAAGMLYRRAAGEAESTKRRPPAPLPDKLAAHLRRWAAMPASGLYIVAYEGDRMARMKRAWGSVRRLAGLDKLVTPHVLRHTAATWLMRAGRPYAEIGRYLGMTEEMVERVYGHHDSNFLRESARALS